MQIGAAVIAALFFSVASTLILGIAPERVLRATEAGAHTLQAPPAASAPAEVQAIKGN
jgi:hypothetical protein